jgi:malate dehydrogenase (oxaloacetate-decarboxylating)(NADP+)
MAYVSQNFSGAPQSLALIQPRIAGAQVSVVARDQRMVFPEGDNEKILRACRVLVEEKIGNPILLGMPDKIQNRAHDFGVDLEGMQMIDPATSDHRVSYVQEMFRLRQRRGVTLQEAESLMNDRNVFGSMMVHMGDADALVSGVTQHFPDTIRPRCRLFACAKACTVSPAVTR